MTPCTRAHAHTHTKPGQNLQGWGKVKPIYFKVKANTGLKYRKERHIWGYGNTEIEPGSRRGSFLCLKNNNDDKKGGYREEPGWGRGENQWRRDWTAHKYYTETLTHSHTHSAFPLWMSFYLVQSHHHRECPFWMLVHILLPFPPLCEFSRKNTFFHGNEKWLSRTISSVIPLEI